MKLGSRELIGTLSVMAALWATSPAAAQAEAGVDVELEASGEVEAGLGPLSERLDEASGGFRDKAERLKAARKELREAWEKEFKPATDATAAEILAARAAFLEARKEQIEEAQQLRRQIVGEMRETLRDRLDEEEWSEEAQVLYQEYQDVKAQLAQSWQETLDGLGEGATRAEIRVAREGFLEANAELVAEQKSLAQELRRLVAESRPQRPERGPLRPEVQALRDEIQATRDAVRDLKRQAREELKNLSPDERDQYIRDLREDLREAHKEIKETRRQIIEEIRDGQDGDRRAED